MAAGKTAVGKAFARYIGWSFRDTDILIEERAGKSISDIFKENGEDAFRRLESQIIGEITSMKNVIVALGGGAVTREHNWQRIEKSGITIWLKTPVDVLDKRIARQTHRPLMADLSPQERREKIIRMLNERRAYYQRAQFTFCRPETSNIDETVQHIFTTLLEEL